MPFVGIVHTRECCSIRLDKISNTPISKPLENRYVYLSCFLRDSVDTFVARSIPPPPPSPRQTAYSSVAHEREKFHSTHGYHSSIHRASNLSCRASLLSITRRALCKLAAIRSHFAFENFHHQPAPTIDRARRDRGQIRGSQITHDPSSRSTIHRFVLYPLARVFHLFSRLRNWNIRMTTLFEYIYRGEHREKKITNNVPPKNPPLDCKTTSSLSVEQLLNE